MTTNCQKRGHSIDVVSSEQQLSPIVVERIAGVLKHQTGIQMDASKSMLMRSRLHKRLRSLGLADFETYCDLIESANGADECAVMCDALTTNVTNFFRESHHFEHLCTAVMPKVMNDLRRGGRCRIWSAACSSGEEPYSIALSILKNFPEVTSYDLKILATDLNDAVLTKARRGSYAEQKMSKIPTEMRNRWFKRIDDEPVTYQASDALRAMVSFRSLNLMNDWPMRGTFDVIFCRNVAIYFDDPTQKRLWHRLSSQLRTQGWLYIGHSERVADAASSSLRQLGTTIYQRTG